MSDFQWVREQVRVAPPNRVLDGMVWCAVNGHKFLSWDGNGVNYCEAQTRDAISYRHGDQVPEYTASIDAALALVQRCLPGWDWIIGHTNDGLTISCQLGPSVPCYGATAPLAIVDALLSALITQENEDG